MSLLCVKGGRECDGCMRCQVEPETVGKCWCGSFIHADEQYYEIDGELIEEDCLRDWAEKYRVRS